MKNTLSFLRRSIRNWSRTKDVVLFYQMSWNSSKNLTSSSYHLVDVLHFIKQDVLIYLPLIFIIFRVIGFIGNAFTFLQPSLRFNTCCIYSLCGSFVDVTNLFVNLFSNYIYASTDNILSLITDSRRCKVETFQSSLFTSIIYQFVKFCRSSIVMLVHVVWPRRSDTFDD